MSSERSPLLQIPPVHLGKAKALVQVEMALRELGIPPPPRSRAAQDWSLQIGAGRTLSLDDLVNEARHAGVTRSLQDLLDARDPIFGGRFSIATDSHAVRLGMAFGAYRKEFAGPGRFSPIESEITDDVIYFRRLACEESAPPTDLASSARAHRAYLLSCTLVVEAFLNRHIEYLERQGNPQAQALAEERAMERKIETLIDCFAPDKMGEVRQSSSWTEFVKLRKERNDLVHPRVPFVSYSPAEMARSFNQVRDGIGGLLALLRACMGMPVLGFIKRLMTAPTVTASHREGKGTLAAL